MPHSVRLRSGMREKYAAGPVENGRFGKFGRKLPRTRRFTDLRLQPTSDERRGLRCHPGLNIRTVRHDVAAAGACRVAVGAQVNGLRAVRRADRRKNGARQVTCEWARRITEDGDRRHVINCLWRQGRRSQIDDTRALRKSTKHHSGVGAAAHHVPYVSDYIVGAGLGTRRESRCRRVVDRVDVH